MTFNSKFDRFISVEKDFILSDRRVIEKTIDLTVFLAAFFTPLLFFTEVRDQFELPKLVFLALLPLFLFLLQPREKGRVGPIFPILTIFIFFGAEIISSLPFNSLSWPVSLLGDYENFSGLATFAASLLWFLFLSGFLDEKKVTRVFFFNSIAALLSALYAVGQHFGFDFIQWNPDSINSTREFASLGNPNFLSAYLAMSLPFFGCLCLRSQAGEDSRSSFGFLSWSWGILGFFLALLGTAKGQSLLHLDSLPAFDLISRSLGLALLGIFFGRALYSPTGWTLLGGASLIFSGLLSTGSRGGFLGALAGLLSWFLILRSEVRGFSGLREKISAIPKPIFQVLSPFLLGGLALFGRPFLIRLWDSTLHAGNSLAVSRLHIWKPAIRMIAAHPLSGVGLDNFKIAFPYYSGIEFNQIDGMFTSSRMAHNELLQIASTTGLLGLGAYLTVLLVFGKWTVQTFRAAPPSRRWLLAALVASAVAYQVQNFFSFGVAALNWLWFFILAAVQAFNRKYPGGPETPAPTHKPAFRGGRILALLLASALFLLALCRLGADIAYGRGSAISDFLKKPDPQASTEDLIFYSDSEIRYFKRAATLMPLEVKYKLYQGLACEQRAHMEPDQAKIWYSGALENYQEALALSGANAYYYNDEGRVEAALSRFDPGYLADAEKAYASAVQWAPASPLFLINWSDALEKTGNKTESELALQKAFALDSGFTGKMLAQTATDLYRSGNRSGAFAYLENILRINNSCEEAYYCRGVFYLAQGEKKKALEDLERAKALPGSSQNSGLQSLDEYIAQAKN